VQGEQIPDQGGERVFAQLSLADVTEHHRDPVVDVQRTADSLRLVDRSVGDDDRTERRASALDSVSSG
jgi:hypothetical protein